MQTFQKKNGVQTFTITKDDAKWAPVLTAAGAVDPSAPPVTPPPPPPPKPTGRWNDMIAGYPRAAFWVAWITHGTGDKAKYYARMATIGSQVAQNQQVNAYGNDMVLGAIVMAILQGKAQGVIGQFNPPVTQELINGVAGEA